MGVVDMSVFSVRVGGGTTPLVRSDNSCKHTIRLSDDNISRKLLPSGHDLHTIVLSSLPDELDELSLEIGGQKMLTWYRGIDLVPGKDLLGLLLPTSLCSYMHIDLLLCYDQQYVRAQEGWESEDEFEDKYDNVSDEDCQFMDDTGEIRWGRRVQARSVSTGRRMRVLRRAAELSVPEIDLSVALHDGTMEEDMDVPIWQKIRLSDTEHIEFLRSKHGLRDVGAQTFEVRNVIRFYQRMAGLNFSHR
jgi:hypothetical protein